MNTPIHSPQASAEPLRITIAHASWGLNCHPHTQDTYATSYDSRKAYAAAEKMQADNALRKVSELCNGKLHCDIAATRELMGFDPSPNCAGKALEIEYRCFSYDRPWNARTLSSKLSIDCNALPNQESAAPTPSAPGG